MSVTARFDIPLLSPGQAQKEVAHNEAIQALEVLTAPSVEEIGRDTPPDSPAVGACYIVGASPIDAWAGKSDCIACYTGGGWRFTEPQDGLFAYVRSISSWALFRNGTWELGIVRGSALVVDGDQVVGPRLPAIASPAGGINPDAEARAAIAEILSALAQHGLIET